MSGPFRSCLNGAKPQEAFYALRYMPLQAILFDKTSWSPSEARQWLTEHGHSPIKRVHVTTNWLRYRLRQPTVSAKYRTTKLGPNILAVVQVE